MADRLAPAKDRPIHLFIGKDPPADLVAAAARGECIVASGPPLKPSMRLARALSRLADWVIEQGDAAKPVEAQVVGLRAE